ncbi:MAG: VWA domain-containing protein [Betaproteobacteria bacterium]|nr:VWA domain-containing protein [Betaproteobacteria bacterium]
MFAGDAPGMVAQLARFAGALRAEELRVGLGDEIDAATVLTHLDLLDRAEVHRALRIAFKLPREAWGIFDRLFAQYWDGDIAAARGAPPTRPQHRQKPLQWKWDGKRVRLVAADEEEDPTGDTPNYSPEAMLRRKPFERCSADEIAELERLIARLAPRLAARKTRRLVPTRQHGSVDLRRSFRHALKSEGDFLRLARRARAIEEPSLVVLYDTSGSMEGYTRLLLAFAFALRRSIRRAEIFAFNTSLARVTPLLSPAEVERSLMELSAGVPDWSGGTRIGECLAEFNARYLDRLVRRNTTVMVFSDGLDQGEPEGLGAAMRELRERAGRILWLNPLLADARYQPEAAGMRAALPHLDYFGPAHNLEALERLTRRAWRA